MQTIATNPTYAAQGATAASWLCSKFPNLARCQEIAAPCPPGHETCGTTISGAQRCCPSGAPAPGPSRKYTLPAGSTGRVRAHRTYRTPRGGMTFNPNVATVTTRYVKRWAPAYTDRAAIGSRGAWVQLPTGDSDVGVFHTPGLRERRVKVLAVDPENQHALIRYRADAAPNPASRSVVSTRARRSRRAVVKVPGTTTASFDWCRWFPNGNKCQDKIASACPPGTEWNGYHCAPAGNPGSPRVRGRRRATVKVNPSVSPAEHRRQAQGGGLAKLGQALRDLGAGRARLVIDSRGIAVRSPQAA
jgi:hypothetical protein